jgi:hypothetical protein
MHYEPNWKKSKCYSGYLKSLDFDMESKLLKIIEYQGNGKECLKQVPIDKVVEVKFIIHHSTGRERNIAYLDITYYKNVRNGRIIVNLPWRYDKKAIEELQEIARIFNIPFFIEKNTGSVLGMLFIFFIITLISILINYN